MNPHYSVLVVFKSFNLLITILKNDYFPVFLFTLCVCPLEDLAYSRLLSSQNPSEKVTGHLEQVIVFDVLTNRLNFNYIELISIAGITNYLLLFVFLMQVDWYRLQLYGNINEVLLKQWIQSNKNKFSFELIRFYYISET